MHSMVHVKTTERLAAVQAHYSPLYTLPVRRIVQLALHADSATDVLPQAG